MHSRILQFLQEPLKELQGMYNFQNNRVKKKPHTQNMNGLNDPTTKCSDFKTKMSHWIF